MELNVANATDRRLIKSLRGCTRPVRTWRSFRPITTALPGPRSPSIRDPTNGGVEDDAVPERRTGDWSRICAFRWLASSVLAVASQEFKGPILDGAVAGLQL